MAISENFKQQCPSCEANVTIKGPSLIGKKVECPRCKYRFVVENPATQDKKKTSADETAGKKKKDAVPGKKKADVEDEEVLDEEEAPAKKGGKGKKKKAAGGNSKLLIGVGLAVVGVVVLGVAAFFLFMGGDDPAPKQVVKGPSGGAPVNPPPVNPDENPDAKKGKDKKDKGKKGGKGGGDTPKASKGTLATVENTNFLPPSSEAVEHFRFKEFLDSPLGKVLVEPPVGLTDEIFKEKIGFSLLAVDDLVVARSLTDKWKFGVIHTTQPIEDMRHLIRGMDLKEWSENASKHNCYVVQRNASWLEALIKLASLASADSSHDDRVEGKPQPLLIHIRNSQTIVVADPQPMTEYLSAAGSFPVNQGTAKKGKATGPYLTVDPELRQMLLHVAPAGEKALLSTAMHVKAALYSRDEKEAAKLFLGDQAFRNVINVIAPRIDRITYIGGSMAMPTRTVMQMTNSIACVTPAESAQFHKALVARLGPQGATLSGNTVDFGLKLDLTGPVLDLFRTAIQADALSIKAEAELAYGRDFQFQLAKGGKELGQKGAADRSILPNNFPPGVFGKSTPIIGTARDPSRGISWMATLLPFMGQDTFYREIEFGRSWREEPNLAVASALIPQFLDPSFPAHSRRLSYPGLPVRVAATHFVGISGVGPESVEARVGDPGMAGKLGIFGYHRSTSLAEIEKGRGLSNTLLMIRVPYDSPSGPTPWMAGGGSTIRSVPEKNSLAPFLSRNNKGEGETYALMADGSVRLLKQGMSDQLFKTLSTVDAPKPPDWKFDEDFPPLAPPKPLPPLPALKGEPQAPPKATGGPPLGGAPTAPKGGGGGTGEKGPAKKDVPPPAGWETYTHEEGGFSIAMPEGAKPVTQEAKGKVSATAVGFTFLDPASKTEYMVLTTKLPGNPDPSAHEQIFEGAKEGAIRDSKAALESESQITLGKYPGREWKLSKQSPVSVEFGYFRCFIVEDRLYVLGVGSPTITTESPEYRNFFSSFRLTNAK